MYSLIQMSYRAENPIGLEWSLKAGLTSVCEGMIFGNSGASLIPGQLC